MIISFDIDGVLTDSFTWAVYTDYVIHGKTSKSYEDFWLDSNKDYGFLEQDNWMKTDIYYSHKNIYYKDREVILKIKELGHTIYYITSRPIEVELATMNWFKRNKLPFTKNIIFNKDKRLVLDSIGADLHIEDMKHHVDQTRLACHTLIRDCIYNWGYEAENVTRIFDLKEVLNYV